MIPIHSVSGKPQCAQPFTSWCGDVHHCTRPEGHETPMHAIATATERAPYSAVAKETS